MYSIQKAYSKLRLLADAKTALTKNSRELAGRVAEPYRLDPCFRGVGQEPYCFLLDREVVLAGSNPRWMRFVPMGRKQRFPPVRSWIWASRELAATQLQVDLADITAVVAHVGQRRLIIVSVYIPDRYLRKTKEENLEELSSRLEMINSLI